MYDLISALKPESKLIISGDCRQLPPIGFGNIFLITAGLYAFGVMLYMLLIRDFQRRVLLGEIEK